MKEEGAGGLLGLTGLEGTIYPGSGPFVEGKTPTPSCLIVLLGEIGVTRLRLT